MDIKFLDVFLNFLLHVFLSFATGHGNLPTAPRTILCVDDDSSVLRYEKALLEKSGYNVLTAESPKQGLALAMMSRLDAVVLDYHMPGMNGHDVAAAIKSLRPEVLIVMFSASENPEETLRLTDAVVHKSDAITELLPTVAHLCNRPSSLPS